MSHHGDDPRSSDQAATPLSPQPPDPASTIDQDPPADWRTLGLRRGDTVDRFTIMEPLGEGGFGMVYVAEQRQPIRRLVALKVIKHGMDTRQVLSRFSAERQALALMDHPNIARVLEAGAMPDGRPWFAMELVRGVPVTEYCDLNQLSIRERLNLFVPICEAVQHAHQKGVIHRDLKPGNVLVEILDGKPVPKIIDFGIAKATSQKLTEHTLYTEQGQLIGTPAYMSPEQAEMSGLDIDTRTDVYALGVILYELLTGTLPFDNRTLRAAGYAAMQRIIREQEPPRPSTRLGTRTEAATEAAKRRGAESLHLSKLVRRELDWIVMKALEKDRNRRYATATALAEDVLAFLHDEPVQARPPSSAYRTSKFVRRYKVAVSAAAVIVVLLLAGVATSTALYLRAESQRALAMKNEAEAVRQKQEAEQALQRAQEAEQLATQQEREAARQQQLADQRATALIVGKVMEAEEAGDVDLALLGWTRLLSLHDESKTAGTSAFRIPIRRDLERLVKPLGQFAHHIRDGAFAPDGRSAVLYTDFDAALYDIEQERVTAQLPNSGTFWSDTAQFSDDSDQLTMLGRWGHRIVWEVSRSSVSHTSQVVSPDSEFDSLPHANAPLNEATVALSRIGPGSLRCWSLTDGSWVSPPIEAAAQLRARLDPTSKADPEDPKWHASYWAISADGRRAFINTGWDRNPAGTSGVFDTQTGELLDVFESDPPLPVHAAEFLPDGRIVTIAADQDSTAIWSRDGDQLLARMAEPSDGDAWSHAIGPQGRYMYTWGAKGVLCRDLSHDGEVVAHDQAIGQVAMARVTQDDRRIVIATLDGRFETRSFPDLRPVTDERIAYHVRGRAFADARFNVAGDQMIAWTDEKDAYLLKARQPGRVSPVAMVDEGYQAHDLGFLRRAPLLVAAGRDGKVHLWTVPELETVRTLTHSEIDDGTGAIYRIALSPDERLLASAGLDGIAKLWQVDTGRLIAEMKHDEGAQIKCIAFSPDGRMILTARADYGGVRLWDGLTGRPLHHLDADKGLSYHAEFSPDSKTVATMTEADEVHLFDTATGELRLTITGHTEDLRCVAFSPDGNTLLTTSQDDTARLWNVHTGEAIGEPMQHGGDVYQASFNADGTLIATAAYDRTARVWDAQTGEPISPPMPHNGTVHNTEFNSDGTTLLTCMAAQEGGQGGAMLWDARTGAPLGPAMLHEKHRSQHATFSPDGRWAATCGDDNTVRLWDVSRTDASADELLALAELAVGAGMDDAGATAPLSAARADELRNYVASLLTSTQPLTPIQRSTLDIVVRKREPVTIEVTVVEAYESPTDVSNVHLACLDTMHSRLSIVIPQSAREAWSVPLTGDPVEQLPGRRMHLVGTLLSSYLAENLVLIPDPDLSQTVSISLARPAGDEQDDQTAPVTIDPTDAVTVATTLFTPVTLELVVWQVRDVGGGAIVLLPTDPSALACITLTGAVTKPLSEQVESLDGARVRVTGHLTMYLGRPQVIVSEPDDFEIVTAAPARP